MTRFYLKTTDEKVTGPFTGIELREAAMANLVIPDDRVAGATDGPWMRAADIGLFSEENVPLPHPPGTPVPEFRLQGIDEPFAKTFKLREVIDFAVRRMLPTDAAIQPVGRNDWIPVNQFGILDACLRGELSRHSTFVTPPPVSADPLRLAPAPRWKGSHTPTTQPESIPPNLNRTLGLDVPPVTANSTGAESNSERSEELDSHVEVDRDVVRKNIQERVANQSKAKLKSRGVGAVVVVALVGFVVWWLMQPTPPRTYQNEVIGNWVRIPSHETGQAFGISFKDDGTCVVFNSDGNCWTGEFQWFDDATGDDLTSSLGPSVNASADVPPQHQRDPVQAGDGYVRLEGGGSEEPPMLEDQPIRVCFVRRDGAFLWMGYLVDVDQTGETPKLNAAWVQLWPRDGAPSLGTLEADMRGKDLIARYGVPDEARALDEREIAANGKPDSATPISLVRYGARRLTLFEDGSIRRFKAP